MTKVFRQLGQFSVVFNLIFHLSGGLVFHLLQNLDHHSQSLITYCFDNILANIVTVPVKLISNKKLQNRNAKLVVC